MRTWCCSAAAISLNVPRVERSSHTGTEVLRNGDWRPLQGDPPPARMNTRLVHDARSNVLVSFGGDWQCRYLAETWLYDLKTRSCPQSKALANPEARAGHFTVYDSGTGWVLVGVVYHRGDLTDMWA